jgi:hypothetical protein
MRCAISWGMGWMEEVYVDIVLWAVLMEEEMHPVERTQREINKKYMVCIANPVFVPFLRGKHFKQTK